MEEFMRVQSCGLLLTMTLLSQLVSATDVGYELSTDDLASIDPTQSMEPAKITFVNRTWAASGIEQADRVLLPPQKFGARKPVTFRIEVGEVRGSSDDTRPQWLDEVAWPRTRDMYGLGRMG